jgi:hypothetical protein
MRDRDLRGAVKQLLLTSSYSDPNTLIVEELGLLHGEGRIDIAVINGELHGYELKSAKDTLNRLPKQVAVYNLIFDRITLVVTPYHIAQATEIIPEWWDITLAEGDLPNEIHFRRIRMGSENTAVSPLEIVKLLWRDEALRLLEDLGAAAGLRSKPRMILYSRLVEILDLAGLRASIRSCLKSRKDWRSDE